ncbi:MAG TPA: sugar nucleotide-binding protein [Actinomycetales bacterium]
MDLLVIGGSGYLGAEVVRRALAEGRSVGATHLRRHATAAGAADGDAGRVSWHRLDVRDRAAVVGLVTRLRPTTVVNAAYRQSQWVTTADGAASVALGAAAAGARLVHVSSDAVFSGGAPSYDEQAHPDPTSAYGAAKAAAETSVAAVSPDAAVVRTSLIVGSDGGSPHERRVHALASGAASGVLFTDDVRCAVHVADLAAALLELTGHAVRGVLHVAGADPVSRHELAVLIARRDGLDPVRLPTGLRAATAVPGPLDVRLDCTSTQRLLGTRLRGAREFLS